MKPDKTSPAASVGEAPTSSGLDIDVSKRLGDFALAARLTLPARGVTALFGVSGSGKTSLLRLIAGLDKPDSGRIALGPHSLVDTRRRIFLPPHKRHLGVVFQEARLFPHYRVRGNLTYGMRSGARHRFDDIVALLGIEPLLDRLPGALSGGEARRVAIGRALLSDPRLLLMDEPLTGLDEARKQELLLYIAALAREIDIPIVYVSHDPEELTAIADHLVLIDDGRVLANGRLDTLLLRFDLTRHFGGFNAASLLTARVVEHDDGYALTQLDLGDGQRLVIPAVALPLGSELRVRVPVRDVALALAPVQASSYRNQLRAVIDSIASLAEDATSVEVRLAVGDHALRARLTRKSCEELGLAPGKAVVALVRSVAFATRSSMSHTGGAASKNAAV